MRHEEQEFITDDLLNLCQLVARNKNCESTDPK